MTKFDGWVPAYFDVIKKSGLKAAVMHGILRDMWDDMPQGSKSMVVKRKELAAAMSISTHDGLTSILKKLNASGLIKWEKESNSANSAWVFYFPDYVPTTAFVKVHKKLLKICGVNSASLFGLLVLKSKKHGLKKFSLSSSEIKKEIRLDVKAQADSIPSLSNHIHVFDNGNKRIFQLRSDWQKSLKEIKLDEGYYKYHSKRFTRRPKGGNFWTTEEEENGLQEDFCSPKITTCVVQKYQDCSPKSATLNTDPFLDTSFQTLEFQVSPSAGERKASGGSVSEAASVRPTVTLKSKPNESEEKPRHRTPEEINAMFVRSAIYNPPPSEWDELTFEEAKNKILTTGCDTTAKMYRIMRAFPELKETINQVAPYHPMARYQTNQ